MASYIRHSYAYLQKLHLLPQKISVLRQPLFKACGHLSISSTATESATLLFAVLVTATSYAQQQSDIDQSYSATLYSATSLHPVDDVRHNSSLGAAIGIHKKNLWSLSELYLGLRATQTSTPHQRFHRPSFAIKGSTRFAHRWQGVVSASVPLGSENRLVKTSELAALQLAIDYTISLSQLTSFQFSAAWNKDFHQFKQNNLGEINQSHGLSALSSFSLQLAKKWRAQASLSATTSRNYHARSSSLLSWGLHLQHQWNQRQTVTIGYESHDSPWSSDGKTWQYDWGSTRRAQIYGSLSWHI